MRAMRKPAGVEGRATELTAGGVYLTCPGARIEIPVEAGEES